MKYQFIFEDYEKEVLPSFYMSFFSDNKNIIWTGGNGHLLNYIRKHELYGDNYAIVFLDYNPWNRQIYDIYRKMLAIIRRFGYHYIIIPICCLEYQYLKSLDKEFLLDINIIDSINSIKSVDEVRTDKITTFESYVKQCASNFVTVDASIDVTQNSTLKYFTHDTYVESLLNRWARFIITFSVFPAISNIQGIDDLYIKTIVFLSLEDILKIHCKTIELCNLWISSTNNNRKMLLPTINGKWFK